VDGHKASGGVTDRQTDRSERIIISYRRSI